MQMTFLKNLKIDGVSEISMIEISAPEKSVSQPSMKNRWLEIEWGFEAEF